MMASLNLSKHGVPHLIIEGSEFPRDKSCADIITSKAIRSLNRTDPQIIPAMRESGALRSVSGTSLFLGDKKIDIPYKGLDGDDNLPSCYSIARKTMDAYLWEKIEKMGIAEQQSNAFVQGITKTDQGYDLKLKNGQQRQCRLLILATGSQTSLTSDFLGDESDRHYALGLRGYFKNVAVENDSFCELFMEKSLLPGGFYIAPMNDGLFNVNIVMRKDKVKKDELNLQDLFKSLLDQHPMIKERFASAQQIGELKGSGLLLGTKNRALTADSCILAGDAAGLIDLISANGIPQAMISGELAAKHAMRCMKENDCSAKSLSAYDSELKDRIKADLSLGKLLSPLLSYNWFNGLVHSTFEKMSHGKRLQQLMYSDHPTRDLFLSSFD